MMYLTKPDQLDCLLLPGVKWFTLTDLLFAYRRNLVYYSNDDLNTISWADLDTGENIVEIASTGIDGVGKWKMAKV